MATGKFFFLRGLCIHDVTQLVAVLPYTSEQQLLLQSGVFNTGLPSLSGVLCCSLPPV